MAMIFLLVALNRKSHFLLLLLYSSIQGVQCGIVVFSKYKERVYFQIFFNCYKLLFYRWLWINRYLEVVSILLPNWSPCTIFKPLSYWPNCDLTTHKWSILYLLSAFLENQTSPFNISTLFERKWFSSIYVFRRT